LKDLRQKLTYANVMATIAVFLVVGGGTAFAASQMLPNNSVGTQQLKSAAVTPAKLSKSAKAGMKGPRGPKGATGATGATGAKGAQGTPGVAGAAATTLFAEVSSAGALLKNSGVVSVTAPSVGRYAVVFNKSVAGCTYQATSGNEGGVFLGVEPLTGTPAGVVVTASAGEVEEVGGAEEYGTVYVPARFSIAVFC
jgi:hypothetical protein